MKIGILRETKMPPDARVPLTPVQCNKVQRLFPGVKVIVQPANVRCFDDAAYDKEGIALADDLGDCDILLGVKEVNIQHLIPGKTYLFFSHTIKKQPHNKALLQSVLEKEIRLLDYEVFTDLRGMRIIGFGRWAGLVGTYLGITALSKRIKLSDAKLPLGCSDLHQMISYASACKLPRLKIALTGDGRVAGGSEEMLKAFGVEKIGVEEFLDSGSDHNRDHPVYVQLSPEYYTKSISGNPFSLSHFFSAPEAYESQFLRFCDKTDLLIMAAYWDPRAPKLFTTDHMQHKDFRIRVIADITCDLNGSVPSTIRTTSLNDPFYDYNRPYGKEEHAFSHDDHITVMSVDNLPCGLPREASQDFGDNLIQYIIPLLIEGDHDDILERATVAEAGKLKERFCYLEDWVRDER
jgi:saccharopine dehydrogenase (NAD+, L-lysine forming)